MGFIISLRDFFRSVILSVDINYLQEKAPDASVPDFGLKQMLAEANVIFLQEGYQPDPIDTQLPRSRKG